MDSNQRILVTCECAPNIALVKYWGKKDENLIIPLNSSISITLDSNILKTKTTIMLIKKDANFNGKDIKIWFNKNLIEFNETDKNLNEIKNYDLINLKRFMRVLNKIRENSKLQDLCSYAIRICTYNSFPTACGLASSASGNACMALALAHAFKYNNDISELARLGSGSACRSCYGGFVKWRTVDSTNSDELSKQSIAIQLFKSNHWNNLNVLIFILNDKHKDVSSTSGMKNSVLTSELLSERVRVVEEKRLVDVENAIAEKNFSKLARLIMKDSNQFHAICMDTCPPLFYLNHKSTEIINLINVFNNDLDGKQTDLKAAYSFDAGPNAFVFIQDEHLDEFLCIIRYFYFEHVNDDEFFKEKFISCNKKQLFESKVFKEKIEYFKKYNFNQTKSNDFIKFMMHSKIGDDPIVILNDSENSLLDLNGEPKAVNQTDQNDHHKAKRIKLDNGFDKETILKTRLNKKLENKFNIYVVEDHNDALEKIYKEIGSKSIQFNELTLIHFDSHPDLSLSRTLTNEFIYNKDLLYSNLSIENWILPAAYAGHINTIVWVKPKWSNQIKCGKYEFYIGIDKSNGYIRVTCKQTYYLTELVYTNEANLINKKLITLYVLDFDDLEASENSLKNEVYDLLKKKSSKSQLKDVLVDIDLDFFSTLDPFKELFKDDYAYSLFKKLYYLPIINENDENFDENYECYKLRKREHMNRILNYLTNSEHDVFEDKELYGLVKEYSAILLKNPELNVDILHNYGEGIDEVGLPHHRTTTDELYSMFNRMETFLEKIFIDLNLLPGLITIARSSLDDYCPRDQVDFIQNEVIGKFKTLFKNSINSIELDYENS